ncbi:pRL2-8 [Streptomyces sp. NPDC127166]|uniref:pRL2-8 n=1 Tax=Streptomyces sp. NPDC127166 TaxID=3345380 RepID=UPI0036283F71
MPTDECKQCVEHAELHKGNWLGLGPQNEPCGPCEDHAKNGCPDRRPKRSWW